MRLEAKARELPVLLLSDDDAVINPALALKLEQRDIRLPRVDQAEDLLLDDLLAKVRAATAGRQGWSVTSSLTLSCFSFAKEAMYRDLLANERLIADHPAISALACSGADMADTEFAFDDIPDAEIDRRAAPENTPVILDADSSQRACIAAAVDGRSFVMDGPPGTGKSQTIANMIGALLHAGKTVLFVSEKAAALDVVRDRLNNAGLRPYLFELHSSKATRKEVAAELGRALDTVLVAPAPMPPADLDAARRRREELNAYADAMNRHRDPLGVSLHHVLGQIAQLANVPAAPAAALSAANLTVAGLGEINSATNSLAAAWRPALEGMSFPWRGITYDGPVDAQLYQAASALRALEGTAKVHASLASAAMLTCPSQAQDLASLLDHLQVKPEGIPDQWLTTPLLDSVANAADLLDSCLADIAACESEAAQSAGVAWETLPPSTRLPEIADLSGLVPAPVGTAELDARKLAALSATTAADAAVLQRRLASLSTLAGMLGLHPPVTFAEAGDLLSVALLAEASPLPLREWLSSSGSERASRAIDALRQARDALDVAEAEATPFYTKAVLGEDVASLAERFTTRHHGIAKLSGEYRADKKLLASFSAGNVGHDTARQRLSLAVTWGNAASAYAAAELQYSSVLGQYYTGRATDFSAAAAALEVARTALRLTAGQDSRIADHLSLQTGQLPGVIPLAREIDPDLNAWRSSLTPGQAELLGGTITAAIAWHQAQSGPLASAASFTESVSAATRHPLAFGQARRLVSLRDRADAAHARLKERAAGFGDVFGGLYAGPRTDIRAVRLAVEWARLLRMRFSPHGGPLTPAQVKAASDAMPAGHLAAMAATWQQARSALTALFDADRGSELAAELDDYRDAAALIDALAQDSGGPGEWRAYHRAREALTAHGLHSVVAFCVTERVPASQVVPVIQRALLQGWAENQLKSDSALAIMRAADRDALVAEYRKLDRALLAGATGKIIRACNAKRPRTDLGEAAVIRREAEKKKRHMPVRTLIERSRTVAQAIKPCFMMSPLSVSQFLPPDLHFDVVIFDEASQVTPGDAINCVYRADALILAGDQKQLPPTNFFTAAGPDDDDEWSEETDDTADFESVLDLAKGAGVFRNLPLRWHYRSRHEALIAFSNISFYKGTLITFPGAHADGPDVGVASFPVDGTYRRGTTRDNPIEAAKVAERVLYHFDTRPGWSLGVVTFSEAQAVAIDTALRDARRNRPDLDRFFDTTDRLRGFFVKSLEAVQGDERDVLIFSVGYGPDENGKITMNFGPLNRQGGWRRLNVAITRAHYRNEIVSTLRPGDIPESAAAEGVRQLRRYLDYAERGPAALALDTSTGGDAESPFEESVITVIRSWGYEVTPQVGTAGYRIDIGVRHPSHSGVYAIGVECDGYQYHSSRAARDRDRLREQVLRGLGWRLHRIWGTAWYRDRNGEERRLRTAIEAAIAAPVHGLLTDAASTVIPNEPPVVETATATFDEIPSWTKPYVIATVSPLPSWIDPGDPGSRFHMTEAIRAIAETEGPVHISVLHERLRDAWNIGRVGSKIRTNIDAAIRLAEVIRHGDFLTGPGPLPTTVRTPVRGCQRQITQIHDRELEEAIVRLTRDASSISQDDLTTAVARLFGWTRRGTDISQRMMTLIRWLLNNGMLSGDEYGLTAAHRT
jgi:very-short-patch-repair endonuclease